MLVSSVLVSGDGILRCAHFPFVSGDQGQTNDRMQASSSDTELCSLLHMCPACCMAGCLLFLIVCASEDVPLLMRHFIWRQQTCILYSIVFERSMYEVGQCSALCYRRRAADDEKMYSLRSACKGQLIRSARRVVTKVMVVPGIFLPTAQQSLVSCTLVHALRPPVRCFTRAIIFYVAQWLSTGSNERRTPR